MMDEQETTSLETYESGDSGEAQVEETFEREPDSDPVEGADAGDDSATQDGPPEGAGEPKAKQKKKAKAPVKGKNTKTKAEPATVGATATATKPKAKVKAKPSVVATVVKGGPKGGAKGKTDPDKAPAKAPKAAAKAGPERGPSCIDVAAKILRSLKGKKGDEGMTTKEMIDKMVEDGSWTSPGGKTPASTLYSSILREMQTKGNSCRFVKVDKGKFAYNKAAE